VIIDYLDERFPHPPLMPIDPITRAQFRVALYRLERDWYGLAREIEADPAGKGAAQSRKVLGEAISASAEVFKAKPFFLSDEFSLVDASIAPILWRLPVYGIELPAQAQPIVRYMNAIFARPTFRTALSPIEKGMHR
jgi:RNA polymerase-associated protein